MIWGAPELIELGALGLGAGALNAAAGGGSLLTFPALIAFGLPPLTANLSNTVAQCPGYVAIVQGYLPELAGTRERVLRLLPAALLGGGAGIAALELASPAAFRAVVPALVILACALLAIQPRVTSMLSRRPGGARAATAGLHAAVAVTCAYAAYFGAGAGVLMLAVLGLFILDSVQRLNALNRLLIMIINVLAAVLFVILGPVSWPAIAVLAPTTMVGGRAGVSYVRRLGPQALRGLVLLIGVGASVYLAVTYW
ncbi:MAG TPA: sulfite exporter TauE/SafE family protein [Solirubrobacteraceae bacterium]|nr:sulfite exporter TauE/SafE family protein [Solirubrobacteraceae bacterium]